MNLTERIINDLPINQKLKIYRDDKFMGFGIAVYPSGVKTYFVEKKINGKTKRIVIAKFNTITISDARKQAQKITLEILNGIDPIEKKRALNKADPSSIPLNKAFALYMGSRKLKPSTQKEYTASFNRVFSSWASKGIADITKEEVEEQYQQHIKRSISDTNHAMKVLRAVLNYAYDRYDINKTNPVRRLSTSRLWHKVKRRTGYIKPDILPQWIKAVHDLENKDVGDYLFFLLLTGLRRGEALKLKWEDVDLKNKVFVIRDTKNGNDHTLPMSDQVHNILIDRGRKGASVFTEGNLRNEVPKIARDIGIKFTCHDLRRTFATCAESLDLSTYTIKALLNHMSGGDVTAGYLIIQVDRLRKPMQAIADKLTTGSIKSNL